MPSLSGTVPMTPLPHSRKTALQLLVALAMALSSLPRMAVAASTDESATKPKTTVSVSLPKEPMLVQINQVALERQGPKRALVEYAGKAGEGSYTVLRDGKPIKRGELRPLQPFTEWGPGKRYFDVDFSDAEQAGRYEVEVRIGEQHAVSPAVPVRDDAVFATTGAQLLGYFKRSRHTDEADRKLRIFQTS